MLELSEIINALTYDEGWSCGDRWEQARTIIMGGLAEGVVYEPLVPSGVSGRKGVIRTLFCLPVFLFAANGPKQPERMDDIFLSAASARVPTTPQ